MKKSPFILLAHFLTTVLILSVVWFTPILGQSGVQDVKKKDMSAIEKSGNKKELNILQFGAKGDGVHNDIPAFEAAKKALAALGGGIIYFPAGKYLSDANGWRVFSSNITLRGDGIDKTYLLTPIHTNAPGIQLAPYRNAGWNNQPEQQYTYEDEAKAGDRFIKLKPGQDRSLFTPGTIFYICAGASYYDQDFGEFNIVDNVVGNTIYLKYPLCKDYNTEKSAWYGSLAADFTPPPVNGSAIASIIRGPVHKQYPYNISIGNELYTVLKMENNNYVLKNIGKGNKADILPAGTKVYKARSICITPSAAYNITIKDMTIEGHRKAAVLSNSVRTLISNVKFIWYPGRDKGGIWLDGDDGRDCIIQDCIVQSDSIIPSQFARSFSDIKVLRSTFIQTSLDFTEFNANCEVANCRFTIKSDNGIRRFPNNPAITIGASTFNTYVHDNIIHIYNRSSAIASQPDIQVYPRNCLHSVVVEYNTIQADRCTSAINIIVLGTTRIYNNIITGSVSSVFGGTGASLYIDANLPAAERKQLISNATCSITYNHFKGSTDGFFARDPNNVIIEDNDINRLGDYTSGGNTRILQNGNIIARSVPDSTVPFLKFVLRNNTFTGWHYTPNSISFNRPINKDVIITNNRFINTTGSFKKEKNFIISITR